MWSEEELRDIAPASPPPRARVARMAAQNLRAGITDLNLTRAALIPHDLTRAAEPAVVYTPQSNAHGNFYTPVYQRIRANPDWHARLAKAHTGKRTNSWCELDTAVSSDALLMNIFCAPRVLAGRALPALLGVERDLRPRFGYRPKTQIASNGPDPTEIDMKLGTLLVEAKLTEADFQTAPARLLDRYPSFPTIFNREELPTHGGQFLGYQLIRGVLAAQAEDSSFAVFCDARRPDLMESWYTVVRAVRSAELRSRLRAYTWQEIATALPKPLQAFLREKYGF